MDTSRRAFELALWVVGLDVRTIEVVHRERNDGRAARVARRRGDPRRVILRVVAQRRADLLALGTHGRSGLAHLLIGSVAEAVVRMVPCDVLVARPVHFAFVLP